MSETKGVIYILTNPSFPEYVKIGYADNVERRLNELNRSECTPFAFRVYATYEVDSRLSDMKIHSIIDKLNPDLRSIDNYKGKKRVREFYAMTAEDAYGILEAIAEIHNFTDRLKKWGLRQEDIIAKEMAEEVKMDNQYDYANILDDQHTLKVEDLSALLDDYLKDKNARNILKYDGYGNKSNVIYFVTNHLDKVFVENKGAKGWWEGNHRSWYSLEIRENYLSLQFICKYDDADRNEMYQICARYLQQVGIKVAKDNPRYAGYFPYVVRMKRDGLTKEILYRTLDNVLLPIIEKEKIYK